LTAILKTAKKNKQVKFSYAEQTTRKFLLKFSLIQSSNHLLVTSHLFQCQVIIILFCFFCYNLPVTSFVICTVCIAYICIY